MTEDILQFYIREFVYDFDVAGVGDPDFILWLKTEFSSILT